MQISLLGLPYHYLYSGLQPLLCSTKHSFMVKIMGILLMVGVKLFLICISSAFDRKNCGLSVQVASRFPIPQSSLSNPCLVTDT